MRNFTIVTLFGIAFILGSLEASDSDYWVSIQIQVRGSGKCVVTVQEGKSGSLEIQNPHQKYSFTPTVIDHRKGVVRIQIVSITIGKDGEENAVFLEAIKTNTKTAVSTSKTPHKLEFLIANIGASPGVCTPPK